MLEAFENAEIYILTGNDREDATSLIELDGMLYAGNPLRVNEYTDFFIVF